MNTMLSGRTLVLCFDGTSDQYSAYNTNVPRLFALLKKDDPAKQLCYYQAGIGTWFNPGVVGPMFRWGAKVLDEAFAWYLDAHVIDGYKFIMNNWKTGDRICLFGFSRGAYTARALAGFIHKIGLLSTGSDEEIPFAYELYKRQDKEGIKLAAGFKGTYCQNQEVKIDFIGVWDTVASVGLLAGRSLPFVTTNNAIKTFRHALSLDERRAKFKANQYHKVVTPDRNTAECPELTRSKASDINPNKKRSQEHSRKEISPFHFQPSSPHKGGEADTYGKCDVLEVWFAGCHTDIGGSAVPNDMPQGLSDITLRWMLREIVKSQCGILFNDDALREAGIVLVMDDSAIKDQDSEDALRPLHDGLKQWWILEVLPMKFMWQDLSGKWITRIRCNLGRGRVIHDHWPMFHSSVKTRMESKIAYKPRAHWKSGTEVYVS
ncbi:hypothetical protein Ac2012v2_005887 [Leucoagaricus gongylophorus]